MSRKMVGKSKENMERLSQFVTKREEEINSYYKTREKQNLSIKKYYSDKIELE
jgi:hypothetical protein